MAVHVGVCSCMGVYMGSVLHAWPCMYVVVPCMAVHVCGDPCMGVHVWECPMHGRACVVMVQAWACMYGVIPYMGVHVEMEDHACACLFDG